MLHRVRHSLGLNNQPTGKLEGTCEADETYIGGQEKNKHQSKKTKGTQGRSLKTKIPVVGIIKRGGELRANVVDGTSGEILKKFIHENLEVGNPLNTDEWLGYKGLSKIFDHNVVKHNSKEYVKGDIHTNTIEGFWAILKRGIMRIYHSMSRKHLQRYVDEFVFRYNTRGFSESYRFDYVLNNINNRLTYKELKNVGNN